MQPEPKMQNPTQTRLLLPKPITMKEVLERGGEGVGQIQFRNSFSFDTFPSFVDCFLSNLGAKVDLISANLMLHSGTKI